MKLMAELREIETPFFVIDQRKLDRNIEDFQSGMARNWDPCRLAYSVKTNSLPWVLRHVREKGLLAEVVSDEEYELCLRCGFTDREIVFNGPVKTKEGFIRALRAGALVNVDSERELSWLEQEGLKPETVGIRVNVPPEAFDPADIEYLEDGFRFGFSEANGAFGKALDRIRSLVPSVKIGLHLHCNSITRSKEVYRAIAEYVVFLVEKYGFSPAFVDVGGGFFGGVPGKTTPEEYFRVIADQLRKSACLGGSFLIAEPGSALIGSVADYVTAVLDVKDTDHARIVTTDGSRIHIDPLWKKKGYSYAVLSDAKTPYSGEQIVCGYTCMDHDRIMKLAGEAELRPGDRIVYEKVGAYTMTFGGPFIRYWPEVYVTDGETLSRVRKRMTVEDYFVCQSE